MIFFGHITCNFSIVFLTPKPRTLTRTVRLVYCIGNCKYVVQHHHHTTTYHVVLRTWGSSQVMRPYCLQRVPDKFLKEKSTFLLNKKICPSVLEQLFMYYKNDWVFSIVLSWYAANAVIFQKWIMAGLIIMEATGQSGHWTSRPLAVDGREIAMFCFCPSWTKLTMERCLFQQHVLNHILERGGVDVATSRRIFS